MRDTLIFPLCEMNRAGPEPGVLCVIDVFRSAANVEDVRRALELRGGRAVVVRIGFSADGPTLEVEYEKAEG